MLPIRNIHHALLKVGSGMYKSKWLLLKICILISLLFYDHCSHHNIPTTKPCPLATNRIYVAFLLAMGARFIRWSFYEWSAFVRTYSVIPQINRILCSNRQQRAPMYDSRRAIHTTDGSQWIESPSLLQLQCDTQPHPLRCPTKTQRNPNRKLPKCSDFLDAIECSMENEDDLQISIGNDA